MSKVPKTIYIIFDKMDGPHLFRSEKKAQRTMRRWCREAKNKDWDSYWDMSDIFEFNKGRNCHE